MRIKIKSCSDGNCWYLGFVGQKLRAIDHGKDFYKVFPVYNGKPTGQGVMWIVKKEDAEKVENIIKWIIKKILK